MTDAGGAGEEALVAQPGVRAGSVTAGQALLAGVRQPIVLILILIAFFTTISGKPLDGLLMLTVAALLVWDATRYRPGGVASLGPGRPASAASPASAAFPAAPVFPASPGSLASPAAPAFPAGLRTGRRNLLAGAGWLAAGLLYAGVVGAFSRYSWPATFPVIALGCLMVAIGWQGPLRQRAALTGLALRRTWLWAIVLVAGGLWELSSLLQQPHLTTDSYAHPTISALTDPLLASHPGRSVALGGWLLIGWFLAGR